MYLSNTAPEFWQNFIFLHAGFSWGFVFTPTASRGAVNLYTAVMTPVEQQAQETATYMNFL